MIGAHLDGIICCGPEPGLCRPHSTLRVDLALTWAPLTNLVTSPALVVRAQDDATADACRVHWQVLEDRFQGLVEGSLASAFAKRRGEDVRQLVAMMVSIGRSGTVEKLYNAARLAPLQVHRLLRYFLGL